MSFNANDRPGVTEVQYSGPSLGGRRFVIEGGTSESAPQAAAAWALVLQACATSASCATAGGAKPYRLGQAAPLLYGIYNGKGKGGLSYNNVFYDVTVGNNGVQVIPSTPNPNPTPIAGYNAGQGWDQTTGLGVPFVRNLIKAVTGV